jgi:hypothetical protein
VQSDRWTAFEKFETEYATQSHRRIAAAWDASLFDHFQPADKYRGEVTTALRCVQTLERMVTAYRRQNLESVVEQYEGWQEHWDHCKDSAESFRDHVQEAYRQIAVQAKQRLQLALDQDDDEQLEKLVLANVPGTRREKLLDYLDRNQLLTPEDRTRTKQALARLAIVREIQRYLAHVDTQQQALALYDEKAAELRLNDSRTLTTQERLALYQARRTRSLEGLRNALISRDDEQIVIAATAALAVGWTLSDETLALVREASERRAARERVSQAGSAQERLIAFDETLLSDDKLLPPGERAAMQSAYELRKPLLTLRRAIQRNDVRIIAALVIDPAQTRDLVAHLDDTEKYVVNQVQMAMQSLDELRNLFQVEPRTEMVLAQIVNLADAPGVAQPLEQLLTPFEKQELRKARIAFQVTDELARLGPAPDIPYVKLAIAKSYRQAQVAEVSLPDTVNWNKIREALAFEEQWSALRRAIEGGDERAIFRAWNPGHLYPALDMLSENEREVLATALQNTSRNERMESALYSKDEARIAFARQESGGILNYGDNS